MATEFHHDPEDGRPSLGVCSRMCSRMQLHQERLASLGRLAATVAHEIGNPLASMSSLVQELRAEDHVESPEILQQLWAQVQRMQERLDNLRQLSRRPGKEAALAVLATVVGRSLEPIRFDPRWSKVRLVEDLQRELRPVVVVEDAIFQIIHNLIFNALDAVVGVLDPVVSVSTGSGDNETVFVAVEDNGAGVREEDRETVFEPFFTTKSDGTGLGLAISRQLVEGMGGRLSLDHGAGCATRFTAVFPTAAANP